MAGALWLAIIVFAIALSVLAAGHDTLPGDLRLSGWLQDLPFPARPLSDIVRAVTGTEVVLATGAAVALVLWLRGYRGDAILLAVGLAVLPLVQVAVKELVDRPRPEADMVILRAGFDSPSFPSGHVTSGVFLYGYLLYLSFRLSLPPTAGWALAAVSLFILIVAGPANVYLGVHWPSDVLGGFAWALALLAPVFAAGACLRGSRNATG